jgi:hypothetical protein
MAQKVASIVKSILVRNKIKSYVNPLCDKCEVTMRMNFLKGFDASACDKNAQTINALKAFKYGVVLPALNLKDAKAMGNLENVELFCLDYYHIVATDSLLFATLPKPFKEAYIVREQRNAMGGSYVSSELVRVRVKTDFDISQFWKWCARMEHLHNIVIVEDSASLNAHTGPMKLRKRIVLGDQHQLLIGAHEKYIV